MGEGIEHDVDKAVFRQMLRLRIAAEELEPVLFNTRGRHSCGEFPIYRLVVECLTFYDQF